MKWIRQLSKNIFFLKKKKKKKHNSSKTNVGCGWSATTYSKPWGGTTHATLQWQQGWS
jgi:hypothetical protein